MVQRKALSRSPSVPSTSGTEVSHQLPTKLTTDAFHCPKGDKFICRLCNTLTEKDQNVPPSKRINGCVEHELSAVRMVTHVITEHGKLFVNNDSQDANLIVSLLLI